MRIKILRPAQQDLCEGYHFYESRSSGLGSTFLDSLFSDIDSLAYFAGIHRVVFGHHRLLTRRFPFAVYYQVIDDVVVVLAVLDCRRDPVTARKRLTEH